MTRIALRFARRELRAGTRGFRLFLACLALGVAAMAGVGSLSRAVHDGIAGESRAMLGGDVAIRNVHRPIGGAEREFLARAGTLSEAVTMRSMARAAQGDRRSLVELKAVDGAYPLYGRLLLDPMQDTAAALGPREAGGARFWGAVADDALFDRLGARVGDRIRVGEAEYELRGRIRHEPDLAGGNGFPLGPRLMVATESLAETGLIQTGSLIYYHDRVRLPAGVDAEAWTRSLADAFPSASWNLRTPGAAAPEIRRLVDRTVQFLALIGLTTLLVGGVGIGNAVRGHLATKTATIATLKCLGATSGLVFRTYLAQLLAMSVLAIAAGIAAGAVVPYAVAAVMDPTVPLPLKTGIHTGPLAVASLFGLLATIAFSLWPLARACRVSPAALFRDLVAPAAARPGWKAYLAVGVAAVALAALAVLDSSDRFLAAWFVAGAVCALAAFAVAGRALRWAASRVRPRHHAVLRLAMANLHRPGAPTGSVVASLGLGLTVLVAIASIEGNLAHLASDTVPARAPGYFFIDIPEAELAGFDAALRSAGALEIDQVPMLRGRVTKVNDVAVADAPIAAGARWMVSTDRGLSWAARAPGNDAIVAGEWWPADYDGPPLVSIDAAAARGMGIGVGASLTVDVLGREVTARIANLRAIDWRSLGINFAIIFSPNALKGAPATHIAAIRGNPKVERAAERAVAARFPSITAVRVRDVADEVARLVGQIADAVRAAAAATIAAGALVLAGAIAAGHRRRVYDAVVLKAMGATRGDIARAFLIEHLALGLAAAGIAAALGTLAARLVTKEIMHIDWAFLPVPIALTAILAAILAIALGFAGTWRALGQPAAPILRNE